MSLEATGLTLGDYNYLKCWTALIRVGKSIFVYVFKSLYKPTEEEDSIRKSLFKRAGYSMKQFKYDFDGNQRRLIDEGKVDSFDIPLLYSLLQKICNLPPPESAVWTSAASNSELPHLLYLVKMKRNEYAHPNPNLNQGAMGTEINQLKDLFQKILQKTKAATNISQNEIENFEINMLKDLDEIKNSQLPANTIADQLKNMLEEKVAIVRSEGRQELINAYNNHTKIQLVPWPLSDDYYKVEDIYTDVTLKYSRSHIMYNQLSPEHSVIKTENVLQTPRQDGTLPGLILITGSSGMGKTTLLKYYIDSWTKGSNQLKGLDAIDILLYMDCRGSNITSTKDLLDQLMPRTAALFGRKDFKSFLFSLNVLMIFDNLSELSEKSLPILDEFINSNNDRIKVLATANQNTASDIVKRAKNKNPFKIDLEGIDKMQLNDCLIKLNSAVPSTEAVSISDFSCFLKQSQHLTTEKLQSPEILTHLFYHWIIESSANQSVTSVTQLFLRSQNLIIDKLKERINSHAILDVLQKKSIENKINVFILELGQVATETIRRNTVHVDHKHILQLVNKCRELNVPEHLLISEVFCFKEMFDKIMQKNSLSVTFPSKSVQEFYSANYICHKVLHTSNEDNQIKSLLLGPELETENLSRIQSVLVFIVGLLHIYSKAELDVRASEIITLLVQTGIEKSNDWLMYVEEAKLCPSFVEKVSDEMTNSWYFEDYAISSGISNLLQINPPKYLNLTVCVDPNEISSLKNIIEMSSQQHSLELTLHIYHHFWIEKKETSDAYLDLCTSNASKFKLIRFAGRLSSPAIMKLPSSLERLALHVTSENIKFLNKRAGHLDNLALLYLNVDIQPMSDLSSIQPLHHPNNDVALAVDFWRITSQSVEWVCDAAKALSSAYSRLVLRKTELSFGDAQRWMSGLKERGVQSLSLVVGSNKKLSQKEQFELAQLAVKFGYEEFKWIQL